MIFFIYLFMFFCREEFELSTLWHELIVSATIGAAFLSALVAGPATGKTPYVQIVILWTQSVSSLLAVYLFVKLAFLSYMTEAYL